jgi:chromosome partitioning protein
MPTVITLAHQKGGVGKSTLALNLYGYFKQNGIKAAIVDIDPQGSIASFIEFAGAETFDLIRRDDFNSYAELGKKIAAYEVVIIDTPPYLSKELIEVFAITNLVLIPCKASLFDAFAIRHTIEFIEAEKAKRKALKAAVVLTMVIPSATLQTQIREHLAGHGLPILETEIGNRVAYAKSLFASGNVIEDDSGKAGEEMQSLAGEILALVSNK